MTSADRGTRSGADAVADFLTDRLGLSFSGARRDHLLGQIEDAMVSVGCTSSASYCSRLQSDPDAYDDLVGRITVGESYFFREPRQIDVLRTTILPERRAARGGRGLRLWSAGCAIGQEAYTLAMVLEEEGLSAESRVLATDISRQALQVAASGIYGRWSLRALSERQRDEYFEHDAMGYRVADRFRGRVAFSPLNLLDPTAATPQDVDVILCRNVLIYFAPAAAQAAGRRLAEALTPGGWLVTGSSDPPLDGVDGLTPTATPAGVAYRRRDRREPPRSSPRAPAAVPTHPRPAASASVPLRRPFAREAPAVSVLETSDAAVDSDADGLAREIRSRGGGGDLEGALDVAARATARHPLRSDVRLLQAVVLLESGRPSDAAAAAKAALYLDAGLVMAHLCLARAEVALGERDAARRSLRNAIKLLRALPPDAEVPLGDGESAQRLLAMAEAHDRAVARGAARRADAP